MIVLLYLLAFVALNASCNASESEQSFERVSLTSGDVNGFRKEGDSDTIAYLGIPFAEPPIGQLRFQPAKAKRPWNDVLEAKAFAPGCPQKCIMPEQACPKETSEDCLYLNVYRPAGEPPKGGWPVFVWIHGGGFTQGAGGVDLYSGENFADNDVILVTINYRLGALGWLNYDDIEGNFGLSDQRMALQWVQDNIDKFGGDKDEVTVGGESAGAMSLLVHLASPASAGLFSRATLESGTIALPYNKPTGKNTFYKELMKEAGCPQSEEDYLQCWRDLSVEEIMDAQAAVMDKKLGLLPLLAQPVDLVEPYYPVINTKEVPLHPLKAFQEGKFNKVPIIIGNNAEEGTLFVDVVFGEKSISKLEYPTVLKLVFGANDTHKILKTYPIWRGLHKRALLEHNNRLLLHWYHEKGSEPL